MSADHSDPHYMQRALALAQAQLGRTAPNPSVGCVIVAGGEIVGEGATGNGGRPHAEEIALQAAGDKARGATAYVTLEPCSERSSGEPSCSERLITAGVARVVIACPDPHPKGAHGAQRLAASGVSVTTGVMQAEAERLNTGFFKLVATGRPWLAIDGEAAGYDAEFDLQRDETFEQALDRLGKSGMTRIFVRSGTALAAQLKARRLVDEDWTSAHTE